MDGMSAETLDWILKVITWALIAFSFLSSWMARKHVRAASYYRGRNDEIEALEKAVSGDDYMFIVRDQIVAYLGRKEAQEFLAGIGLGEDDAEADAK